MYRLTTDRSTAITPSVHWTKITEQTPYGVKMLLISKPHGVAVISIRRKEDTWTHWAPLPTFAPETEDTYEQT
jgi:hypothetical protein